MQSYHSYDYQSVAFAGQISCPGAVRKTTYRFCVPLHIILTTCSFGLHRYKSFSTCLYSAFSRTLKSVIHHKEFCCVRKVVLCMKKLFLILMTFCTLLIGGTALASDYPKYLGGDPNFILVDAKMGTGWYVDRSSLVVQKYAPPSYAIAVNICTVPDADRGSTAISQVKTYRFFYNWNYRSMYVNQNGQ